MVIMNTITPAGPGCAFFLHRWFERHPGAHIKQQCALIYGISG
jgi:hypothetical protein